VVDLGHDPHGEHDLDDAAVVGHEVYGNSEVAGKRLALTRKGTHERNPARIEKRRCEQHGKDGFGLELACRGICDEDGQEIEGRLCESVENDIGGAR